MWLGKEVVFVALLVLELVASDENSSTGAATDNKAHMMETPHRILRDVSYK
jgi:hypothetical protein